MNSSKINNIIYDIFLYGGYVYLLTIVIYSIFLCPIGADSGYYLQSIQYLNEGLWPYRDFQFGYTPGLFIFAPIKKIFGVGNCYAFDMFVFWLIEIACGYTVYKFAQQMGISNKISKLVGLSFLIIAAHIGGQSFLLEMPSVLCGIGAMSLILSKNDRWHIALLAGLLTGLAFLFKQYGLGFLGLCLYIICVYKQSIAKSIVLLLAGFCISCLCAIIIFGQPMVDMLAHSHYQGFDDGGNSLSYKVYIWAKVYFKIVAPILALMPFAIFITSNSDRKHCWRELSILLLGLIGFFLQFYFGGFDHYAIYNIPFICVLCAWIYEHAQNAKLQKIWMILILLNMGYVAAKTVSGIIMTNTRRAEQLKTAEIFKQNIDPKKSIFMIDNRLIAYYYLLDVQPPLVQKYGLSFGNEPLERLKIQIELASYIIKEENSLVITDEFSELMNEKEKINQIGHFEIWK